MMGIGIWKLLIILAIVVMLFGTKRLRSLGTDLGGAISGFRKAMGESDSVERVTTDQPPEKSPNLP